MPELVKHCKVVLEADVNQCLVPRSMKGRIAESKKRSALSPRCQLLESRSYVRQERAVQQYRLVCEADF
jgi:hypothetical protein